MIKVINYEQFLKIILKISKLQNPEIYKVSPKEALNRLIYGKLV